MPSPPQAQRSRRRARGGRVPVKPDIGCAAGFHRAVAHTAAEHSRRADDAVLSTSPRTHLAERRASKSSRPSCSERGTAHVCATATGPRMTRGHACAVHPARTRAGGSASETARQPAPVTSPWRSHGLASHASPFSSLCCRLPLPRPKTTALGGLAATAPVWLSCSWRAPHPWSRCWSPMHRTPAHHIAAPHRRRHRT